MSDARYSPAEYSKMVQRVLAGESRTKVAREYGIATATLWKRVAKIIGTTSQSESSQGLRQYRSKKPRKFGVVKRRDNKRPS